MIKRLELFLGPGRLRLLVGLLLGTGLGNVTLGFFVDQFTWVPAVQTIFALTFVFGTIFIIGSALDPFERGRYASIFLPALGLVFIGLFFAPGLWLLLVGGAVGWVIAGLFIFRPRGPMEYQKAVKHLRRSEFSEAVKMMDTIIKAEPQQINHYRFRAEILRLWGKLDRARKDYRKIIKLAPDSPEGYNGLSEVELQADRLEPALQAAQQAYDLAPDQWVTAYNLGLIEDRLGHSEAAIEHLQKALTAKIPDPQQSQLYPLLMHLFMARAYARLGDSDAVAVHVDKLLDYQNGLKRWKLILNSDQAEPLQNVLSDDVALAEALMNDPQSVDLLVADA